MIFQLLFSDFCLFKRKREICLGMRNSFQVHYTTEIAYQTLNKNRAILHEI